MGLYTKAGGLINGVIIKLRTTRPYKRGGGGVAYTRGGGWLIYGVLRYTDEFLLSTYNFKVASYKLQGIKPATLVKLGKICQTCFFFPCKYMKLEKFLSQCCF